MSLRTKLMLSIFVCMVLVVGLLTLNLWLDAARRTQEEARRGADLVASMVSDLVGLWMSRSPVWTDEDWTALSWKMEQSGLISGWTVAEGKKGELRAVISSERIPERILKEEEDLMVEAMERVRVDARRSRVYVPLRTAQGGRFAARLDLRGFAVPSTGMADVMRGILTIMAVGTALLLLNVYIFTNRLVLRPLDALVEASGRVAAGDFSRKIPGDGGYDEMGRLVGAFNLMLDQISEHHRTLENDIRQARGRITETERKLFAAQRLSTTGTLAAGIAHEINNPLGGMINAARTLQKGGLDEAKRAEYLGLISDGLDRVRAIVQKILQFRPGAFEPQPVRLKETVEKAVAFIEHRARAKEVEIRSDLPADLPPAKGDPLELQQAVLNVLMNAVDACVLGEGKITVTGRALGDSLSVSVADNGCGMDEGELARCLDPFFTTKDVGEGTGLGLAVANNIVTNHGGKIDITSQRGRGTTVTLVLPVLKLAAPVSG